MNPKVIMELLNELRVLPYFPNDEYVMASLVRLVGKMATHESQVEWLVSRMTSGIYSQWPGPQEMRACFCDKFKPADGINAYSTVYLDGIPPERPKLPPAKLKELPVGAVPIDRDQPQDPRMQAAVRIAAETIALKNHSISGPATAEEIAAAPEWLRKLDGFE